MPFNRIPVTWSFSKISLGSYSLMLIKSADIIGFSNIKINEKPAPIIDDKNYSIVNNSFQNANISNNQDLLIFL